MDTNSGPHIHQNTKRDVAWMMSRVIQLKRLTKPIRALRYDGVRGAR
jgi:hypothetical protein